jgi:DNA-binding beta-propeller fold protein YncE
MTTARISALLAVLVFATAPTTSARQAKQRTAPEIPFASAPDFLRLPDDIHFGEVPGVAVDSKGRIYVFSRSGSASGPAYGPVAAQLLEFAPTGKFIREIGRNLYGWAFAHSVRIDRNDNIWAIDKGSDMIVKFNQAGRVEWVFGRRKESADGAEPWEHVTPPLAPQVARFRQPTDVAWDSQGNIYISDGYINSRVAKFDRNGDWVMSFGEPGNGPGQFNTPHAIAIDNQDNVYVGDRGNQRVQVFDTNGKYIREWKIEIPPDYTTRAVNGPTPPPGSMDGVGAPNSLCITPGPNQVMFLGESTWPGRIFKVTLDGRVLGVIGKSGRNLKQFSGAHALACPSENEIYVAESSNWRVQKLMLKSTPARPSAGQ